MIVSLWLGLREFGLDSGSKRTSTVQGSKLSNLLKMAAAILICFGFNFLQWKEVETRRPSFFTVYDISACIQMFF